MYKSNVESIILNVNVPSVWRVYVEGYGGVVCVCMEWGGSAPSSNVKSVFRYKIHIYFKNTSQVSGLYLSNGLQTDSPNN